MMAIDVSAIILTKNSAQYLNECLSALKSLDEIIVLDTGSTDDTLQIAASYPNVRIHFKEFKGFGELKNYAVSLAKHDWVFSIDSDEVASPELIEDIGNIIQDENLLGVVKRLNYYNGKAVNGASWRNDFIVRLFNRRRTSFNLNPVHESIVRKDLKTEILEGCLHHYAFNNMKDLINKAQFYSCLYASQNRFKKKVSFYMVPAKAFYAFMKNYFLKKGMLYGKEGFLVSMANSIGVYYKYMKLYEENNSLSTSLIITTYNRKDALKLVLKSVLLQTVLPKEVIIADDGSSSDTADLIVSLKKDFPVPLIHCWHEDEGFRLAEIRNKAIRKASCEYIIMIDGDVVLHPQFVENHLKEAEKGCFVQGSRVLLSDQTTQKHLLKEDINFKWFDKGIENRLNALNISVLSQFFTRKNQSYLGVRGCNMAFWKEDVEMVNGFNEDFIGWGREDSEFVVRLLNNGLSRKNLKFGGTVFHLYHPENNREMLPQNDQILEYTIAKKLKSCKNGIKKINAKKEYIYT